MKIFYPSEISKEMQARILYWPRGRLITSIVKQPDRPAPYCLYFIFLNIIDENELIRKLSNEGISGIITSRPVTLELWRKANIGVMVADNISAAFLLAAGIYRKTFDIPFVEVIGSSGKSTVKTMIGEMLGVKYATLTGIDNYNAPLGVAYNITKLKGYHEACVLEAGMKASGVIAASSKLIKPNIAVVTTIHRAHLMRLGSMDNIVKVKSEILEHLEEEGTLILNGDNEYCLKAPFIDFKGKIITFGLTDKCDLRATDICVQGFKTSFKAVAYDFELDCTINTIAKFNITNALAAIAVGRKLGLTCEEIAEGLRRFTPLSGRLQITEGINSSVLINDNFNANPDSTKEIIRELPIFCDGKPIIAVMGDMESPTLADEEYARSVHFNIGQQIAAQKIYKLVAIGKWAEYYLYGALHAGMDVDNLVYFKEVEEGLEILKEWLIPGCVYFFKASPYVEVKKLIPKLLSN